MLSRWIQTLISKDSIQRPERGFIFLTTPTYSCRSQLLNNGWAHQNILVLSNLELFLSIHYCFALNVWTTWMSSDCRSLEELCCLTTIRRHAIRLGNKGARHPWSQQQEHVISAAFSHGQAEGNVQELAPNHKNSQENELVWGKNGREVYKWSCETLTVGVQVEMPPVFMILFCHFSIITWFFHLSFLYVRLNLDGWLAKRKEAKGMTETGFCEPLNDSNIWWRISYHYSHGYFTLMGLFHYFLHHYINWQIIQIMIQISVL